MKLLVSTAAVLLSATAASAADLMPQAAEPATPGAVAYSWTGFYGGLQAGYATSLSREQLYENWRGPTRWALSRLNPQGAIGGVYAGYNYDFGNGLVLGADADFTLSGMRNTSGLLVYAKPSSVYLNGDIDRSRVNWTGALRGRIGYAFDRFLPYLAGGVAFAKFSDSITHTYVKGVRLDATPVGWTVGAGLDYALTDNLILRAEYRYSRFGDIGSMITARTGINRYDQHVDYDLNIHDVRVGLAYKF